MNISVIKFTIIPIDNFTQDKEYISYKNIHDPVYSTYIEIDRNFEALCVLFQ